LASIHLLKNGIGDSGAMALATALEDNKHVRELNLRCALNATCRSPSDVAHDLASAWFPDVGGDGCC
jgi:hypothetical protein